MSVTVAIVARDEERMIAAAIASAAWADEVLVVDGGSRDATVERARSAGARVVGRPFDDFARQRNFALEQGKGSWVFFLDADERIPADLADELRTVVSADAPHDAYAVPRRNLAFGRWLRWHPGGPDMPVRLLRKGAARWTGAVHETVEGARSIGALRTALVHLTHRSVAEVVRKIDQYSEYEADALARAGARTPTARSILLSFPKAAWSLWRSGLRREGVEGAIEAVLLAFNRTLVLAKVWERTRGERLEERYARAESEIAIAGAPERGRR